MKNILILFFTLVLFVCNISINAQWEKIYEDTSGNDVNILATSVNTKSIFVAKENGLFVSRDNGRNWELVNEIFHDINIKALVIKEDTIFAGSWNRFLYRSVDNGITWELSNSGITSTVTTFYITDNEIFAGTFNGIYKSVNNGLTWVPINNGLKTTILSINKHDNMIFAGTYRGLFGSDNDGVKWDSLNCSDKAIYSITVCENNIIVGTEYYTQHNFLKISHDNGTTWEFVNIDPLGEAVWQLITTEKYVFAATSEGIYRSTDCGVNWGVINDGWENDFTYNAIKSVTINADTVVVAFEYRFGISSIWLRAFSEILSSTEKWKIRFPLKYSLSQNYPNPFNPSTTISYSLPKSGFVQLKVYDILGREVTNLVNIEQSSGNYKIEFNASSLTSGIYFYKLQSGSFTETKKLILLR